jgi:hypothetical protein
VWQPGSTSIRSDAGRSKRGRPAAHHARVVGWRTNDRDERRVHFARFTR